MTTNTSNPIPFARPFLGEEEALAAADVVRSGWIVGGPRLAAFEEAFAELCGGQQAVGASSWTTAAFLLLRALGVGPGDEVIVPSYTFIATVNVITHAGAKPVFADIDPDSWNMDPAHAESLIGPNTRAIMPVDQLGLPCDMDAFVEIAARHGLILIDDAACALGSRNRDRPVGSMGDFAVFSLHARKVVTAAEGGVIVLDDAALAERMRVLRNQGMSLSSLERHNASPTTFETYPEVGFNFRLTDIQAAIAQAQLGRLPEILSQRVRIANRYIEYLSNHPLLSPPAVPEGMTHNWQSFMLAVRPDGPLTRNGWMEALHERGIPTRRSVMAAHVEPPYAGTAGPLPVTEHALNHNFQLPIYPDLSDSDVDRVLGALQEITDSRG